MPTVIVQRRAGLENATLAALPRAIRDPWLDQALSTIHQLPAEPWTAERLAVAGMSRSAFCARFRNLLDEPPKRYLAGWRMCRAGMALRSGAGIADAAALATYDSAAAFGRAFKRVTGPPPGRMRLPQPKKPANGPR